MKIHRIFLKGVKVKSIIGINTNERNNKQCIIINCIVDVPNEYVKIHEKINCTINYKTLLKLVKIFVSKSSYYLLETLCCELSYFLIKCLRVRYILLKIEKIEVLKDIKKVGVIVERDL